MTASREPHAALQRFVEAQDGVYKIALGEIRSGHKQSHWMWFILPQLASLGRSATAEFYGLAGLEEARSYWQHPILGARYRECLQALLQLQGHTAEQVFGYPDVLKLCSSLTLFRQVDEGGLCGQVLTKYYAAEPDPRTLELLSRRD